MLLLLLAPGCGAVGLRRGGLRRAAHPPPPRDRDHGAPSPAVFAEDGQRRQVRAGRGDGPGRRSGEEQGHAQANNNSTNHIALIILYHIILYYIVLYYIVLYYIILWYSILY